MKIFIAGAGGVLGKNLVKTCLDRGFDVIAAAYDTREFDALEDHAQLTTVAFDVTHPESLSGLCEGADMVISCVGITRMKGSLTHMDVDCRGNLNLLREAERAGVKKFGVVSPAGVEEGANRTPMLKAKRLFEDALKAGPLDWVVFHSGGFYNDLAEMGRMAEKGPMFVIGSGTNRFTPIHVGELASIVMDDMAEKANEVIDVGGPEDMSWVEICEACFAQHQRKPLILKVPAWMCRACLCILKPFSARHYAMGKLIVFMSTIDLPTAKRGRVRLRDYLASCEEKACMRDARARASELTSFA